MLLKVRSTYTVLPLEDARWQSISLIAEDFARFPAYREFSKNAPDLTEIVLCLAPASLMKTWGANGNTEHLHAIFNAQTSGFEDDYKVIINEGGGVFAENREGLPAEAVAGAWLLGICEGILEATAFAICAAGETPFELNRTDRLDGVLRAARNTLPMDTRVSLPFDWVYSQTIFNDDFLNKLGKALLKTV